MIFIKKNGEIVRADGKDAREVVSLQRADFPEEGNVNIIYIATDENKVYRWDETEEDYIPVGSDGKTYTAGNGIVIEDDTIIIDDEIVATKEDLEDYRTASEQDVIDAQKENTSNKISSLNDATDNVKYLGAKVVKDELQNVRSVAEGKCKSLVISYEDTDTIAEIKTALTGDNKAILHSKSKPEGEDITQAILDGDYNSARNLNEQLNSNKKDISVAPNGFLLTKKGLTTAREYHLWIATQTFPTKSLEKYFNVGDIVYVREIDVPDRWFSGFDMYTHISALETTKVDLTNYYNKDEVDELLEDKANVGDSYTKQEADNLLDDKANSSDVYSKTDADDTFATKTELGDKQDKSTARTITTATFNGGLISNEFTEFANPMTSLTIASLEVATGDDTPAFAFHFKLATGGTISFTPTIKWDCGNPVFEANVDYLVVITKVGSSYFGALGEHY